MNDFYIEDAIDIDNSFIISRCVEITYDILTHQSLEISAINNILYYKSGDWYRLEKCKIVNTKCYGNFISYTVMYNTRVKIDSIQEKRKIKIGKLFKTNSK